jgi:AcrR family transcriptional regulator
MSVIREISEETGTRGEERRRRILDAAATVFARRGYHQAKTREIAREAGVAEGTIYNYFPSKRDLLLAIIDQVVTESIPMMCQDQDCADLPTILSCFLADRLAMLERNSQLLKAVVPEMINDADLREGYLQQVAVHLVNALVPVHQRALTLARTRPFNPRVLLPALAGATIAAFVFNEMAAFPMGKAATRQELTEELVHLFLGGLYHLPDGPRSDSMTGSDSAAPQPCSRPAVSAGGSKVARPTLPNLAGR